MTDQVNTDRRSVLKTAGGVAVGSALGSFATGSAMAAHDDGGTAVRVNQVGYPKDAHKIALVTSAMADVESLSSYEVVDASSGETVDSGSLTQSFDDSGWEALEEPASGHTVKQADFSGVTAAGEYKVVVGDHESRPFQIGEPGEVYGDLLADVGRLYTIKRANADIQDPVTGLDIGPGHMQDENAIVQEPAPDAADFLEDYEAGQEIDVTGGWYDAGDYGKYTVTHAVTAAQMMLAYDRNPDAFSEGQFDIPDSLEDPNVGEMPDVLAEVKYGMQFLSKMQRPDGGVFFKVAKSGPDENFPEMTAAPTDITADRYVLGLSSAGTAMAVGAFAMAARVFEGIEDDYAEEMLTKAENGFEWLQENSEVVWEKSLHQDSASGEYGRGDTDAPERYWAAAELLRTTGDSTYDTYIQDNLQDQLESGRNPIDWNNAGTLGHLAYAKADGEMANTVRTTLQKAVWLGQRFDATHENGIDPYATGLYDFYWGCVKSGVSRATQFQWGLEESTVDYIGPDKAIADWAFEPLHHALGRSATGFSYVSGHGEKSVVNVHDRIIQSQNMEDPIPGMLVGGPHNNLYDADTGEELYDSGIYDHVTSDTPHQLSFADLHDAYPVSEWAINYTAPLFLALAEVPGMTPSDGGDPGPDPELSAPSNLSVSNTTESSVTVSWDSADGVEEYTVSAGDSEQTVSAGTTSATVEGLEADTTYTVTVTAVAGSMSESASVDATTDDDGGGGESSIALDLSMTEVGPDAETTASVTLSEAPNGLSGFDLTVTVADPSVATITGGSLSSGLEVLGGEPTEIADDGASILVSGADLSQSIQAGASDVELATIEFAGRAQGSTDIAVSVQTMDADNGDLMEPQTMGATLTVSGLEPIADDGDMPMDIDDDGVYEDLNGNGELDYNDVVLYFQNMRDPEMTDNVGAYDLNDNDRLDFDDVVELFQEHSATNDV